MALVLALGPLGLVCRGPEWGSSLLSIWRFSLEVKSEQGAGTLVTQLIPQIDVFLSLKMGREK